MTCVPRWAPRASGRTFGSTAPQGSTAIELCLGGAHNVANALAACAAAASAGATLEQIAAGLAAVRAVPGRLQFKQSQSGAWLIDDSYNANPSSVRAAIEVLASLSGRKWLVLGDMGELGAFAAEAHADIGEFARAAGDRAAVCDGAPDAARGGQFRCRRALVRQRRGAHRERR